MSALDDYKIFLNILANDEDGIMRDIINKWAKAKAVTHMIDQGKMMPPPVPPEITESTESPIESPIESPTESPKLLNESTPPETISGKYDNL